MVAGPGPGAGPYLFPADPHQGTVACPVSVSVVTLLAARAPRRAACWWRWPPWSPCWPRWPCPPPPVGAATPFETYSADASLTGGHADVLRLYWAFFDREPDVDGARYWVTQSNQCASLRVIADSFAVSAEFAATYGALDDAGLVDLVYANVLDRTPDDAGRAYWLGELGARRLDRPGLVLYFSLSAEFRLRHPLPSDGRPDVPCVPPKPLTIVSPPVVDQPKPAVYYVNCTAAWNAGAAPIFRGEPGYRPGLDSNSDGEACERDPR